MVVFKTSDYFNHTLITKKLDKKYQLVIETLAKNPK